jgi:ATP-dependent exoDNAse (exonuclease V) beta subunit
VTIHKAKGLQFKAVILPFCDWELSSRSSGTNDTILWCTTEGTPFNSIPLVPIKYKKAVSETLFANKYFEEMIMAYVDSLNILYVALTRAEEAMIIGMPETPQEGSLKKSGHLLMAAARNGSVLNENFHSDLRNLTDNKGFVVGRLTENKRKTDPDSLPWIIESYPVKLRNEELRLSLKSKEYFLPHKNGNEDHRDFGNIMHDIFSLINSSEDIDSAILKYQNEGFLKKEDAYRLKELFSKKLENPKVKGWFSRDIEVLNEREIMSEGESYRPDRVVLDKDKAIVIDYKFGLQEIMKHQRQISKYMELLQSMKYKEIRGYLWYVMLDKIVEIK